MQPVDALRAKIEGLQVRELRFQNGEAERQSFEEEERESAVGSIDQTHLFVFPLSSPSLPLLLFFSQLELTQAETQAASNGAAAAEGESLIAPYSRSYGRTPIATALAPSVTPSGDQQEGNLALVGTELTVGGWVRTGREALAGALAFVGLNDGSCQGVLQVVLPAEVAAAFAAERASSSSPSSSAAAPSPPSAAPADAASTMKAACQMGACILVSGIVVLSKPPDPEKLKRDREAGRPEKKTQLVELKATKLLHLGPCDNGKGAYPLAGKGRHTLEHLRDVAHLRPRTATFGAISRIRSCLAAAAHEFFQQRGFHYVTSPLITASDCEGAGEMFQVTTLLQRADGDFLREKEGGSGAPDASSASAAPAAAAKEEAAAAAAPAAAAKEEEDGKPAFVPTLSPEEIEALEASAAEFGDRVRALKGAKAPKEDVEAAVALLKEVRFFPRPLEREREREREREKRLTQKAHLSFSPLSSYLPITTNKRTRPRKRSSPRRGARRPRRSRRPRARKRQQLRPPPPPPPPLQVPPPLRSRPLQSCSAGSRDPPPTARSTTAQTSSGSRLS